MVECLEFDSAVNDDVVNTLGLMFGLGTLNNEDMEHDDDGKMFRFRRDPDPQRSSEGNLSHPLAFKNVGKVAVQNVNGDLVPMYFGLFNVYGLRIGLSRIFQSVRVVDLPDDVTGVFFNNVEGAAGITSQIAVRYIGRRTPGGGLVDLRSRTDRYFEPFSCD